jgi:RNA polymerase sigma-70 factor, ECF subfamily
MVMELRIARAEAPSAAGEDLRASVAACEPELRRRALALTASQADAADLVQDTVERALRSLDRFRPGTNLRVWLLTIMKNLFFDQCRSSGARKRAIQGAPDLEQPATTEQVEHEPAIPLWARVSPEQFRAAVGRLDGVSREMFRLRATENLAYHEIAERLAVPPSTVGTRLFRSRNKLRRLLLAEMGAPGDAAGGGADLDADEGGGEA